MNTPVSFELALTLKEKGFDKPVIKSYRISVNPERGLPTEPITDENTYFPNVKESIPAPTIAEVVMWLYDNYKIWITVYTMDKWSANGNDREQLFDYSLKQMKLGLIDIPKKPEEFNSPTESYEKAIKYALNNLI